MDSATLRTLLGSHEDNFVERKSDAVKDAELRQTASAFANTVPEGREAVLFIGVHDRTGEVIGVRNPDALQKRIRNVCENDCYPPIAYSTDVISIGDHVVVAIVFPASRHKPHFTGPAYVRVGSESKKASASQFDELLHSRVDKCRELLRYKNTVVTVRGIGYRLGTHKPLRDVNYVEHMECHVEDCTPHLLKLHNIASGTHFSEPLGSVTIVYDDQKARPMLLITGSTP